MKSFDSGWRGWASIEGSIPLPAFLLAGRPASRVDGLPFQVTTMESVDLATYGGISMAVVGILQAVKRLFPAWVDGKEPMLALVLAVVLGVAAKFAGTFGTTTDAKSWLVHGVMLVVAAAGSGVIHDKILNVGGKK